MYVEETSRANAYRGYNPEFYKRVMAKRKAADAAAEDERTKARLEAEKREAEEELRRQEDRAKHSVAKLLAQYREMEITHGKKPVRTIILETALKHGFRYEDILGKSRRKVVIAARHEAIWRAYCERTDLSLKQLGRAFGGLDHTTISFAVRKMERIHGSKCRGGT